MKTFLIPILIVCWFSDIYGCDPNQVRRVLARSCRNYQNIVREDWDWVVQGTSMTA